MRAAWDEQQGPAREVLKVFTMADGGRLSRRFFAIEIFIIEGVFGLAARAVI